MRSPADGVADPRVALPMLGRVALQDRAPHWIKVLDQTRCIGCHACTTACKSENDVPIGVTRTYVKAAEVGLFPQVRRTFQVTRCNQCTDAPCVTACPTAAMFKRPDGIVDFDKSVCIGCKACIAACPYDAIFINPADHSAEKCNFCAHRLDVGLEPACVTVCPTSAILVGDLNDPASAVANIVGRQPVSVRRPEKETSPNVFYRGAHQATLDPLAARRPSGDTYMWSEKGSGPQLVESGHPGVANSSAAVLLAYDVPHRAPWDWRVSLYTWTKGISAGAYLVPLALVVSGLLPAASAVWEVLAPLVAGVFLALTGLLLLLDLEHPLRFYLIFTRPQLRSWLVRGAIIISLYGGVLAIHFLAGAADTFALLHASPLLLGLSVVGAPLALLSAVYTAYLFAQARARDLWQDPLLPTHMGLQAILAGASATLPLVAWLEPSSITSTALLLSGAAVLHLAMVAGAVTLTHPTAHARLAVHEMTRGRYARVFWLSSLMTLLGGAVALLVVWGLGDVTRAVVAGLASLLSLGGLLSYEHAFVQAGQSVPLA
jgi:Fe-S-cluster-containing dehydrogenase component/Ni/Fe-hydrogenase subunit HybB-like protein